MNTRFKLEWPQQIIHYICLLSLLFSLTIPPSLCADCELTDEQRSRAAVGLVGVTLVGLAAGLGCIAASSNHRHHHSSHCHHHSHCSYGCSSHGCYSDSYSNYCNYSGSSYCSNYYSSDYDYTGLNSLLSNQTVASITDNTLSGAFTSNANLSLLGRGSVTPFIQLPDGTVNTLDSLSFSNTSSSTPFGPFNQKGTYAFGLIVNPGTILSSESNIAIVNINVNGTTVQSAELTLPPNPPANFRTNLVHFSLL